MRARGHGAPSRLNVLPRPRAQGTWALVQRKQEILRLLAMEKGGAASGDEEEAAQKGEGCLSPEWSASDETLEADAPCDAPSLESLPDVCICFTRPRTRTWARGWGKYLVVEDALGATPPLPPPRTAKWTRPLKSKYVDQTARTSAEPLRWPSIRVA